jgi:phage baseplate assembly protein W
MAQWIDIDINLEKKDDGDIAHMKDSDAIKNSLKNIFQTIQGSRRMMPDFATPIHKILFEPMNETVAGRLGSWIESGIIQWENRIEVIGIHIEADYTKSKYNVTIKFIMTGSELVKTYSDSFNKI